MNHSFDLTSHSVQGLDGVYYLPNFIAPEEEEYVIRKIQSSPQPQWKNLAKRRLQIWGGDITPKGVLIAQQMPPFVDRFPDIISRIASTGVFKSSLHKRPNHVIMNEYLPGQGIMPHEDGPRYHPVVATLSLGSHTVFHYYRYEKEISDDSAVSGGHGKTINMTPLSSVLLEPRSLIISLGTMYTSHLHGIEETDEDVVSLDGARGIAISNFSLLGDHSLQRLVQENIPLKRGIRYSLTCRDVERVSSGLNVYGRHQSDNRSDKIK